MPDPKQYDVRRVLDDIIHRGGEKGILERLKKPTVKSFNFDQNLFQAQRDFIDDPARMKAALCSRRAGKTFCCCYYLIRESLSLPEAICVYIGLTRQSAKRLMWTELKRANRHYNLGMHFNNAELMVTFPNGSQIMLAGANDDADIDKLRGSPYRLVVMDECASFGPHIESLVTDVIEPSLVDYDGTMALIGTPGASCSGLFYRATTGIDAGYKTHRWTIRDNPHIPNAQKWLDERIKQRGWTVDHPVYLREWCGQWVRDENSLVYKFNAERNVFDGELNPDFDYEFVMGLDLGYNDATAFSIGAFSEDDDTFYIVESTKAERLIPARIADRIREYQARYRIDRIICDTGGLGKSIAEEFKQRYGLPIKAAEKTKKNSYIEHFNSDLISGRIKVAESCTGLINEWLALQWDESGEKEDKRYENHLCDSSLYMWRMSRHYLFEADVIAPSRGSQAYWDSVERSIWDCAEAKLQKDDGSDFDNVDTDTYWSGTWHQ